MSLIFFYDTETTGLNPSKHCVHQFAFIIEKDGEEIKRGAYYIRPPKGAKIEPEAMEICFPDLTTDEATKKIRDYPMSYEDAHSELTKTLSTYVDRYDNRDKMFLCGYNISSFDNKFLHTIFEYSNDPYMFSYFWSGPLDAFILAAFMLRDVRADIGSLTLQKACEAFLIEFKEDEAHNAIYDTEKTRELYKILEI